MKSKNLLVSLVAIFALALFCISSVSAISGVITNVEVNGEPSLGKRISVFAGETVPVRVTFNVDPSVTQPIEDVRVRIEIVGSRDKSYASERFDVFPNGVYTRVVPITIPFDIDPKEDMKLRVEVEGASGDAWTDAIVTLQSQRESYLVEILDANMPSKISAGENLPIDIVLKNRGTHEAEDTFVKVSIPSLGIEQKGYFQDLSPLDQGGNDEPEKEDSAERRLFLEIPDDAKAGIYSVEIEAYNSDAFTTLSRRIAISSSADESRVVTPSASKNLGVGEEGKFSVTIVNTGNKVKIYELSVDAGEGLTVELESLAVVQAGSSKTVEVDATASKAGKHTFTVNVMSEDGDLVKSQSFTANVEGAYKGSGTSGGTTNTTVLLTVVLAIIFVVLLVVLIVLLTRKPEKPKEFGESYY